MCNTDVDPWLVENLVCPIDKSPLFLDRGGFVSNAGRRYPEVDGIPIMLTDGTQTIELANVSMRLAENCADSLFIDSVGVSPQEASGIRELIALGNSSVDPVVSYQVGSTNGNSYKHLIGTLKEYPIPELRLPPGEGKTVLDIGGSWGRWSIAAARKAYRPIVLDPSLGAVMAARRVFRQMGLDGSFIVGDARRLPFRTKALDVVFSYSVIQHFSKTDATETVSEIGRVLKTGGESLVQMPTVFGLRCLYHQLRRRFREPRDFEVRYYTVPALKRMFQANIGPTRTSVDCFFGIGLQRSDLRYMTPFLKTVVLASELLRATSRFFPPIKYLADSVYLSSRKLA